MWSRELQGDSLQRKGGTSSQAGPLTATSPKVGTMPEEVTCRWGHKQGSESAAQPWRAAGDAAPRRSFCGAAWLTHLHVDAAVAALAQRREGVGAIGRVEIGAGRDGVLSVLGRVTAPAPRQGVLQVVVGPAESQGEDMEKAQGSQRIP